MELNKITRILVAIPFAALPIFLYAYAEGPDAGLAGVPGEATCASCHSGGSGTGNVSVAFPSGLSYTPGVKQHLVVTVADSSQRRWGFELTARRSSSNTAQAGTFTPGPDRYTQLVCTQTAFQTESFGSSCPSSMPLQYIEHTLSGTRDGTRGSVTFQFDWTPPSANAGNIVIYVAGNAANGDGNITGDHIYTQRYTLTPAPLNTTSITGVVNAASFQPGITAGSWVTIQGSNLANSARTWTSNEIVNGALPKQLDGVSVTIDGNPAAVYYISPTQLNVQAPDDTATGPVIVVVTNNGAVSPPATATLQPASPAFFPWPGHYAVATRPDYSLVAPANLFAGATTIPAKPGEVIILWGTGFGTTNPPVPAGQEAPSGQVAFVVNLPTVSIGNVPAQVIGAALTPGDAGVYQIAVQVPSGLANGDQPLVVQVVGFQSPAGVLLNVQN
jgi:uncharacterized protein (TIGR03437 family)